MKFSLIPALFPQNSKMSMISRLRNLALGRWYNNITLPTASETGGAMPVFQPWYEFNSDSQTWAPFDCEQATARYEKNTEKDFELAHDSRLILATWNVDGHATASAPEARISSIISHLESLIPQADIIFLQEVSRPALSTLLAIPWLRNYWYLSEVDTVNWGTQPIKNITLVSRSRLSTTHLTLGPIWTVKYPSRFERVALCCDILLPLPKQTQTQSCSASPSPPNHYPRIRLINVHLDSLPINPSLRPIQLSTTASYLRAAGHGLVAGDFNPVLPTDETLIRDNGLVDAWEKLHPGEDGFTWGIDGKQPFPPNRLDKVAVVAVKVHDIQVVPPGTCMASATSGQSKGQEQEEQLPWSDHSGLLCSFGLE